MKDASYPAPTGTGLRGVHHSGTGPKLSTLIAGGDLPNLMQVQAGSIAAFDQFLRARCLDLTDYLAGDAVSAYPALANIPQNSWASGCVVDGRLYGLPIDRGVSFTWLLYGRQDLLEKKGITEDPRSFAEFRDLCVELTDAKRNVWALASSPLDEIRKMLKIPNGWSVQGGEFVSAVEHEAQEEALEAARKMVESGVVHPDSLVDTSKWQQWFAAGSAYFHSNTYSGWFSLYQTFGADYPDMRVRPMQYPGFDGGSGAGWLGPASKHIVALSKESKDRAETILKIADYLASPFGTEEYRYLSYGIEGRHYTSKGSDPVPIPEKVPEIKLDVRYLGSGPMAMYYPADSDEVRAQYEHQLEFTKTAVTDPSAGLFSPTSSRRGAALGQQMSDLANDIVLGRKPVSAWRKGVEEWRGGGGRNIARELAGARAANTR
ncbi:extracellular solute-binding protein [Streptomyces sp. NPDC047981]|uniref:extracellular solute-binding protein n=1 Tax=Streptomyces sp. NPDC047981 TaxID=3154610 RepID=UPI00342312E6